LHFATPKGVKGQASESKRYAVGQPLSPVYRDRYNKHSTASPSEAIKGHCCC